MNDPRPTETKRRNRSQSINPSISMWRKPAVLSVTGKADSSHHEDILAGLMTPSVPLGSGRSVGWPDYEIEAIVAARIAGKSDDDIRRLVSWLISRREHAFDNNRLASVCGEEFNFARVQSGGEQA